MQRTCRSPNRNSICAGFEVRERNTSNDIILPHHHHQHHAVLQVELAAYHDSQLVTCVARCAMQNVYKLFFILIGCLGWILRIRLRGTVDNWLVDLKESIIAPSFGQLPFIAHQRDLQACFSLLNLGSRILQTKQRPGVQRTGEKCAAQSWLQTSPH